MSTPILEVKNIKKHFPIHGGIMYRKVGNVYAVDDVSFEVKQGETLGLVGESGCGKTTLGRTLLHLYEPTSGDVVFNGQSLSDLSSKEMRELRKEMQIIFQDPMESLNPRLTVGSILEEPFIIHKEAHPFNTPEKRRKEIQRLLKEVGLPENSFDRYPHEFSGGQRQRIGIARAIALKPKLIVCDEPVSALDVSVQSQVLNLMVRLQKELDLTFVFVAHNLAVVKYISDRIAVMYLGKIVELADAETIYEKPLHPYTEALISAIPVPDPTVKINSKPLEGDVPSPITPPTGCHFHTRCPYVQEKCKTEAPVLQGDTSKVACHFPLNEV